ncbi:MAG: SDR family NAD(P)-dependent oxidoreductase [Beijerinckiaceae bacterium]|jgi:gluconate 5-dehydrogenase|nr:SDR family NAD(P)-dependent oxidoreductase [Beijerinckiaceae bacterium]
MENPTTLFRLDGRTALVTGASRGLGKTIASALGSAGAQVILAGRDEKALEKNCYELRRSSVSASVYIIDLEDEANYTSGLQD